MFVKNEDFINRSNNIHNYKYNYELCDYINYRTGVIILCPIHGIFNQKPEYHQLLLLLYDYSLVDYKNNNSKVKIICQKHGIFEQKPRNHTSGQGCLLCKHDKMKLNIVDFIQRSNVTHDFCYDYSLVEYKNNYTKVKIICKKHGIFEQAPNYHILGQGCPSCKKSLMEEKISKLLDELNIYYCRQQIFKKCKNINCLPFDFYIPEKNMVIEYHGKQHYEPIKWFGGLKTFNYIKNNDIIKKQYCDNNNIRFVEISYKDDKKINDIINEICFG